MKEQRIREKKLVQTSTEFHAQPFRYGFAQKKFNGDRDRAQKLFLGFQFRWRLKFVILIFLDSLARKTFQILPSFHVLLIDSASCIESEGMLEKTGSPCLLISHSYLTINAGFVAL